VVADEQQGRQWMIVLHGWWLPQLLVMLASLLASCWCWGHDRCGVVMVWWCFWCCCWWWLNGDVDVTTSNCHCCCCHWHWHHCCQLFDVVCWAAEACSPSSCNLVAMVPTLKWKGYWSLTRSMGGWSWWMVVGAVADGAATVFLCVWEYCRCSWMICCCCSCFDVKILPPWWQTRSGEWFPCSGNGWGHCPWPQWWSWWGGSCWHFLWVVS